MLARFALSVSLTPKAPLFQPYTIGYLHAWTSGGAEWNWSPGYVGHSVFSESDTWAAKLETERGPVVRVWEYDRLNHTCVIAPPTPPHTHTLIPEDGLWVGVGAERGRWI